MGHGGSRTGSGRKPGSAPKAEPHQKAALADLAQHHTESAICALVEVATNGRSEAARVTAATALLDRAYGRPPQALDVDLEARLRALEEAEARLRALEEDIKAYDAPPSN